MPINHTIRDHMIFRVILQGMSHPGNVLSLPDLHEDEPSVFAVLGCLMDNEVTLSVIGDPALEAALARHTASRTARSQDADYIIVRNGTTRSKLANFKRGSLEYPDTGATVLFLVEELSEATGVVLSGPGVNGTASLRITGLDPGELQLLREANSEFPLGVDAIFLDQSGHIACIPRSSQIGVN
ncbi:MAG: phosphonate C-P lyase system protein PhnH [Desulfatirhabdiaceae bacterium]